MNIPFSFSARVIATKYIAKETKSVFFEVLNANFSFHTGQFVNIKVDTKTMRAYSIASSSQLLPQFELCVKIIENGKGSGYIDSLQIGDSVEFMGPFGHFGRKNMEKNIILLGTGTGIAPLKAIIEEEIKMQSHKNITLVYGVKSEEFACYDEYFKDMSIKNIHFSYELWISQPITETVKNTGRITQWIEEKEISFFENSEILICGNPSMVKEAKMILMEQKNISKENIIFEAF